MKGLITTSIKFIFILIMVTGNRLTTAFGKADNTALSLSSERIQYVKSDNPFLESYEQYAIKQNPSIQAAYHNWKASRDRVKISTRIPNPTISLGYFLTPVETAVGPQEYKISFSQPIPWLKKLSVKKNIQSLQAGIEYQKLRALIYELRTNLHNTYYDYYFLQQSISITENQLELVKQWENLVQTSYKTASRSYTDLIQVQIERIKLEEELRSLKTRQSPLISTFQSLLNADTLTHIHLPESLTVTPVLVSREYLDSIIVTQNPLVQQLREQKSMASANLQQSKLGYYPDFGLGFDWILTGEKYTSGDSPVKDSGKDPLALMVSINVPLWIKKQRHEVSAARNLDKKSALEYQNLSNNLNAELTRVLYELDDSYKKAVRYQTDLIPMSLEYLHTSEKDLPVADKSESQEICFIPDNNYGKFLRKYISDSSVSGHILNKEGKVIGKHKGIIYYTIGQRKRIGISAREPLHVININDKNNTITVGKKENVYSDELVADNINLIFSNELKTPIKLKAKIRYNHKAAPATISTLDGNRIKLKFDTPQWAITPGQAVVFYMPQTEKLPSYSAKRVISNDYNDIVIGGRTILSIKY